MTIYFVTGTDTEVGKTVVTAALATILRSRGDSVAVVKPAQTGVGPGDPGDVDVVRRLVGDLDVAEGVRLPDALAPDTAAAIAGVELPGLCDQRDLILTAAAEHDAVLVEGAGGVTVSLGKAFDLLSIARMVQEKDPRIEWIVVARAGLGTLNHTNLTVWKIQDSGFYVQGIVIGSWPNDPGLAELHNRNDLSRHSGVPVLGAVPEGAGSLDPAAFQAQAPGWIPYLSID
ncbi:MAG TPA: dethiobiotin synthase [Nocardioidaceae bacterium]|nr:dethiobiotin synthase [Nocardioidaceae bacterium]